MTVADGYDLILERFGLPGSAGMRLILEELMTADQSRMVLELPGSPREVAEATGLDQERVKESLEELFFKGAVFPRGDMRRRENYRFPRGFIQLHDATMASGELDLKKDGRLFQLWWDFMTEEFYPRTSERKAEPGGTPGLRIVPAYKAIKDLDGVLPADNYVELLKAQTRIAVTPCPCRLMTAAHGEPCSIHGETEHWACLSFGRAADYVVERGSGKELSIEEALELNDVIEQSGLLHWWINEDNFNATKFGCNCCRDCCAGLVPLDLAGLPISRGWAKTRFEAYVVLNDCDGCQVCVDRCAFDAIEMERVEGSKRLKAVVDPEKCFGCGVCVLGCDPDALKMKIVRPPEHIPPPVLRTTDPAHG